MSMHIKLIENCYKCFFFHLKPDLQIFEEKKYDFFGQISMRVDEGLFLGTSSFQLSKKTWSKYVNLKYAIAGTRSPSKSFPELTDFASGGIKVLMFPMETIELRIINVGRSHLSASIEL